MKLIVLYLNLRDIPYKNMLDRVLNETFILLHNLTNVTPNSQYIVPSVSPCLLIRNPLTLMVGRIRVYYRLPELFINILYIV